MVLATYHFANNNQVAQAQAGNRTLMTLILPDFRRFLEVNIIIKKQSALICVYLRVSAFYLFPRFKSDMVVDYGQ